ncbi:pentapeptide repeat-containing protein [Alkalimarinus coralli]|nr:pentapeptide repeat-containing protein [Alkalimarinus coralli]
MMGKHEELEMILSRHQRWLESEERDGSRADLSGASLDGANLVGKTLSGVDFSGASLVGADLSGARLVHAKFTGADLAGVNLSKADLLLADFTGANLKGANLTDATPNLDTALVRTRRGPRFKDSDLTGANLSGAYCYISDFSGAKLTDCLFNKSYLVRANLSHLDLQHNPFNMAVLSKADLSYANLQHADFTHSVLDHANLSYTTLSQASLKGANLKGANLDNAQVEGIQYDRKGIYRGSRVATCYGSSRFRRFAQDQDFIEEFREAHPVYYGFWLALTDCGRSMTRVVSWSIGFAILFGCIFYSLGESAFDIANQTTLPWSLFTMVYYSVVTFTTLGFGDITPTTPLSAAVVMIEVVVGYLMLGILISILADKVARRS